MRENAADCLWSRFSAYFADFTRETGRTTTEERVYLGEVNAGGVVHAAVCGAEVSHAAVLAGPLWIAGAIGLAQRRGEAAEAVS